MIPHYPIYVPSRGRSHIKMTVSILIKQRVPHYVVVEPQEADAYAAAFPESNVLVLPKRDQGVVFVRNWIWDHAVNSGAERHWQIDDNTNGFMRRYKSIRIPMDSGLALALMEKFVDRYQNIGLAGPNYEMFAPSSLKLKPFVTNVHVYSCTLINHSLPFRFRLPNANEDTDLCLQTLSSNWATVLFNAFLLRKARTMTISGGQTDTQYVDDGRWFMASSLASKWPGVVDVKRRFQRPQHVIRSSWRKFDIPLILKDDIHLEDFQKIDEYGMHVRKLKEPQHGKIKKIYDSFRSDDHVR